MLFYTEVLRLEPPVPIGSLQTMTQDCSIKVGDKNIVFEKGMGFHSVFHAIQHDPKEWIQPDLLKPERFDFS